MSRFEAFGSSSVEQTAFDDRGTTRAEICIPFYEDAQDSAKITMEPARSMRMNLRERLGGRALYYLNVFLFNTLFYDLLLELGSI